MEEGGESNTGASMSQRGEKREREESTETATVDEPQAKRPRLAQAEGDDGSPAALPTPSVPGVDSYDVVLLDIEGTTTSISFVANVLFPFARAQLPQYLEAEWGSDDLNSVLLDLATFAVTTDGPARVTDEGTKDTLTAIHGSGGVSESGKDKESVCGAVVAYVNYLMDSDLKVTALKALQGRIWKAGYASGELKGHMYSDVLPQMRAWKAAGKSIYIYSSGSIGAQKLLFGHSVEGDILELFSGHFDTTSGSKLEKASYETIVGEIGSPAERVLFVTDNLHEVTPALQAGLQVVISVRPGNKVLPAQINSFAEFGLV